MNFDRDESPDSSLPPSDGPVRAKRRARPKTQRKAAQAKRMPAGETVVSEWIELMPHGISVATTIGRPVLILKDQSGVDVLPVWMQPLDAGVAMAELSHTTSATPHAVTRRLLEMMKVTVESCVFVDLIGHHQFVNLNLRSFNAATGENEFKTLRVRADEAMSFCLQARARFYSTRALMAKCRDLDTDLAKLEQNLNEGQLPTLQAEMEISSKKHPYVM